MVTIYEDDAVEISVKKSAQCGVSGYLISTALWYPAEWEANYLYLFPKKTQMNDFSMARIKPAIQLSPELAKLCDRVDNVGLKKIGKGYLYCRGSEAVEQIISVDADAIGFDEYDFMTPANMDIAEKRIGGSELKIIRRVSTPTYPDFGIDTAYRSGDQREWHIKCDHCGEWQVLDFFKNVEVTMANRENPEGRVVCVKCKKPIDRLMPGEWVAAYPDNDHHTYHISKLMSSRSTIAELIKASLKTDSQSIQIFHNYDLGKAFEPKGGRLSREAIAACRREAVQLTDSYGGSNPVTMGVDVGSVLHVRISEHLPTGEKKALWIGTREMTDGMTELDPLMDAYKVRIAIIDELPETASARAFCDKFEGRAFMCRYAGETQKERIVVDEDKSLVTVKRTEMLDVTFNRFRTQMNLLPMSALDIDDGDYLAQLKNTMRVVEKDTKGIPRPRYIDSGPDHYAHAENYDEVATSMVTGQVTAASGSSEDAEEEARREAAERGETLEPEEDKPYAARRSSRWA